MSDNIKPIGWNATTGKPEVADTTYSTTLASNFVQLDGGETGGVQNITLNQLADTALTVNNSNAAADAYFQAAAENAVIKMSVTGSNDGNVAGITTTGSTYVQNTYAVGTRTITDKFVASGRAVQVTQCDALTGNTNNWAGPPTDSDYTAELWKISSDAARTLTGIVGPAAGMERFLTLFNEGAFTISLSHQSFSSSAANRFYFSTGTTVSLSSGSSIMLFYDDSANFWFDVNSSIRSSALSGSVITNGDTTASQEIAATTNNAVELEVTTSSNGTSGSALVGTNSPTASIALVSYGSGYTDATRQSATEISSSTGTNGLIIHNSTGDPIKFEIGTAERLRFNTQGWAPGTDTQAITAVGNTITPTAPTMILNPDGNYTLTSNPTITAGTVIGQRVILTCAEAEANTVTINDNATDPGTNVFLYNAGVSRVIGNHSISEFMWNGTSWIEMYNNAL